MKTFVLIFLFLISSCGLQNDKESASFGGCSSENVPEGVRFTCTDQEGAIHITTLRHGEQGARGERGPAGLAGERGEGLQITSKTTCGGEIEGWLEESSYQVSFQKIVFATGDRFLSSIVGLQRGDESINTRVASAFYLQDFPHSLLSDGRFVMRYVEGVLHVSSQGGLEVSLPCEEVL